VLIPALSHFLLRGVGAEAAVKRAPVSGAAAQAAS